MIESTFRVRNNKPSFSFKNANITYKTKNLRTLCITSIRKCNTKYSINLSVDHRYMKISFVSPRLYRYISSDSQKPAGGAQRQQSMISTQLASRDYDVSAIVADYGHSSRDRHGGVKLIKGVPETLSGISSVFEAVYGLARSMYTVDADVYLVRGSPRLATTTSLISKVLQKRFIFRIANDTDVDLSYLKARYNWLFNYLYCVSISHADIVIAQTRKQRQLLRNNFGVEAKVVPNGYDLPPSSELLPHRERSYVLWVGSSDPDKKNPYLFLRLAKRVPEVSFKMISQPIPGNEDLHEEIKKETSSISNLDFIGTVAPNDVHSYYREAMLLVNTSNYEGFPNTFLEAWRYETPIVSLYFDLDGLLGKKLCGIRAGTMEALIKVVRKTIGDPSTRSKLGKNGRTYMEKNFSLDMVVDLYEEALSCAIK